MDAGVRRTFTRQGSQVRTLHRPPVKTRTYAESGRAPRCSASALQVLAHSKARPVRALSFLAFARRQCAGSRHAEWLRLRLHLSFLGGQGGAHECPSGDFATIAVCPAPAKLGREFAMCRGLTWPLLPPKWCKVVRRRFLIPPWPPSARLSQPKGTPWSARQLAFRQTCIERSNRLPRSRRFLSAGSCAMLLRSTSWTAGRSWLRRANRNGLQCISPGVAGAFGQAD